MSHLVLFSGGIGSWAAARRLRDQGIAPADLTLLFTDTRSEDADTYRWLHAAADNLGVPVTTIADGRTIWEVFRDVKFLGNSRVDPCSRVLKRDLARRWITEHCDTGTTIVVGIDWTEHHRWDRMQARWLPWRVAAPLCDAPYLTKPQLHAWAAAEGLWQQRLYGLGMPHANCGGGCVKAGIGHFLRLLQADPVRFAEWEANEQALRDQLGDVSILRDRTGDQSRPMSLREARERQEAGASFDLFEIGGCGCMVDEAEPAA